MQQLLISFIIPAFNEELFLPQVLKSIRAHTPISLPYEIIVVDNGSEDRTVELAKQNDAKVIINKEANIGELRNIAVGVSRGSILIFLDADILVTEEWGRNITEIYNSLIDSPYQVTGSRYGIPTPASWIEKVWFKPLVTKPSKYINSGHLITSRVLFDDVGGFDANLETGEDYAFCQSALQEKAVIHNNPSLAVIHKGYPKSVYQFMRREMWHGRGDCDSLRSIWSSRVAVISILFVFLHGAAFFSIAVSLTLMSVFSLLLILSICFSAAVYKHDARMLKDVLLVSFLYYLYFVSRFLSCVSFMSNRSVKRKED